MIKNIILGLLIAAVSAAPSKYVDFTCPESDIAATGCMGPKDCLYPHTSDCSKFIHCEVNADGKTGRPTVKDCPSGLQWNDNKKECDWPSESTCGGQGSTAPPSTTQPSTAQPTTGAPASTEQSGGQSTPDSGNNNQAPCSEEEIAQTGCKGPKDCLYPNPANCNSFIQCTVNADGKTGTPVVMPCPSDLEWNDNKKECDYSGESTCNKGSTAGNPSTTQSTGGDASTEGRPSTINGGSKPTTPSSGNENIPPCSEEEIAQTGCKGPKDCLYPNPANCNSFIQCTVNADGKTGTPVVMPCPSDLEWNDNKKECDWPSSSTCGGKGTTAQPSTAQPSTAQPSTAQPTTGAPASTEQSGGQSTPDSGNNNKPPCSEEEIAQTGCKGPKDCLYPNPENCNSFIQCTVNADNKTGTPVVMPCPSGLEWNDNKKECDWPSSSTCGGKGTTAQPSTAQPSTAQPSTAQPSTAEPSTEKPSTEQPSTAQPTTGAPVSTEQSGGQSTPDSGNNNKPPCSEEEIAQTGCKGPKDCLYPNPENCNSFIQCTVNADNKTGSPVVMPCPSGLEWNDNKKECDWPSSSTCGGKGTTAQPSTAQPSTAQPSTEKPSTSQPSTAEPSTEQPSTAQPSTAEPSTAKPSTAEPSTEQPSTAQPSTAEPSTAKPSTAEPSTEQPTSEANSEEPTTEQSQTSTLPACRPDDDDNDSDLDLGEICGNGCSSPRTVAHPSNNRKYIICSSTNSVRKCAEGLLYSKDQLSCTYAGLVSETGPSRR